MRTVSSGEATGNRRAAGASSNVSARERAKDSRSKGRPLAAKTSILKTVSRLATDPPM